MGFKESVLVVALIVVFALMILISTVLFKSKNVMHVDSCPDYWTTLNKKDKNAACLKTEFGCCSDYATPKTDVDGTNCPIKCYNSHQLGKVSPTCTSIPSVIDFGTEEYTGSAGLCNKQTWAKKCDITWDGITNVALDC
jgi:hypothetical protein